MLDCLEYLTANSTDAAIIWLHGLGADNNDFYEIVPLLELPTNARIRLVFPNAPIQAVSLNGGMPMHSWFDVFGFGDRYPEDSEGLDRVATQISELIAREKSRGIATSRILLAGFSQGGAAAVYTGLRYPERLGGILVLSAYLPREKKLAEEAHSANRDTPIAIMHGSHDPVIPFRLAERAREVLENSAYSVEWYEYDMPHTLCPLQFADIGAWIWQRLEA